MVSPVDVRSNYDVDLYVSDVAPFRLPALTRGEGVLECTFDHYRPVRGTIPTRPRTDHNPLNRKEYLLHVARRD